jgi:hypothetical protein
MLLGAFGATLCQYGCDAGVGAIGVGQQRRLLASPVAYSTRSQNRPEVNRRLASTLVAVVRPRIQGLEVVRSALELAAKAMSRQAREESTLQD